MSNPVIRQSTTVSALNLEAEMLFALRQVYGVSRWNKLPSLGPSLADRDAVSIVNSVGLYDKESRTVQSKESSCVLLTKRDF